jgi:lysophospholipase L1-like esterase
MARLLGTAILMALLVGSVACSSQTARNLQHNGEETRQHTAARENTVTPETTSKGAASGESSVGGRTMEVIGASASWDYVALGDSLAAGVGAHRGYVDRYAHYVGIDTEASVDVVNLGQSGQTSSQLLDSLRNDRSMRRKLRAAEIITFNIGINDLGEAGEAYENGSCGGEDNLQCLRAAVERVKGNWDAIISELLGLRSTDKALIRTAGIGYTPRVDEHFKPYLHEVNRHIATTAAENEIPYAQPYLDKGYINPDGVHPNDDGYEVIADRLRELGYSPLES